MSYGITAAGFIIKPFSVIRAEIQESMRAVFGAEVNLAPDSFVGRLVDAESERVAFIWELAADLYAAMHRDSATNTNLDRIAGRQGITRFPATKSIVTALFGGTALTSIPAGNQVATPAGDIFETLEDAEIGAGGTVSVATRALEVGAIPANAGTLTIINTPLSGWDTATNLLDATLGNIIETDTELRVRWVLALTEAGSGNIDAIAARLRSEVDGVSFALCRENDSDVTDGDGRPTKSIEAIVEGGAAQDIVDKIWIVKGTAIEAHGLAPPDGFLGVAIDTQGISHDIGYSFVDDEPLSVHVELSVDATFDQGAEQETNIGATAAGAAGEFYTLQIAGELFSYESVGVDSEATILAALDGLITAVSGPTSGSLPVTSEIFGGKLLLKSLYPGVPFAVSIVTTNMAFENDGQITATGDQIKMIADILAWANLNQGIGIDFIETRYSTPINLTAGVTDINIRRKANVPIDDPITGWSSGNLSATYRQRYDLDSTRLFVEIV